MEGMLMSVCVCGIHISFQPYFIFLAQISKILSLLSISTCEVVTSKAIANIRKKLFQGKKCYTFP